jgi:hypothetical protein
MEDTPAAQVFVLAEATNCTGELTVLLGVGEVTTTPVWPELEPATVMPTAVDEAPPQWSHSSTTVFWTPAVMLKEVLICCAPLAK